MWHQRLFIAKKHGINFSPFIDDSEQHVKGAGECGINAYLLPKNMELISLLNELNLL